jgi:hypothetical protein
VQEPRGYRGSILVLRVAVEAVAARRWVGGHYLPTLESDRGSAGFFAWRRTPRCRDRHRKLGAMHEATAGFLARASAKWCTGRLVEGPVYRKNDLKLTRVTTGTLSQ